MNAPRWIRMPGVALLLALPLLSGAATADVVVIVAEKDAALYSEDGKKANGDGEYFFAGNTDGGDQRRSVIAFDIAGNVPAGASIDSVSLQLYMSRSQIAGTRTVELHRVLTDWERGAHEPGRRGGGWRLRTAGRRHLDLHRLRPGRRGGLAPVGKRNHGRKRRR